MSRTSRRQFLQTSLAASAVFSTFTIAGTKSSGKVIGANGTIRVAVAGINGRGKSHIEGFAGQKNVQITHLADPDSRLFDSRSDMVKKIGKNDPTCVQDFRTVLDDPNIDVLTIATPNHWHALMTILACQAGKDVYVEKPCSHNIHEGRVAVEAARKHGRIVQHGTQNRSGKVGLEAAELAKSGKAGKLLVSRGLCYKKRNSIGTKPNEQAPAELDYSLWLGPAAEHPFNKNFVHYNWHWFWDFGNGDIGNQGVHQMDLARWGIPGATWPTKVTSWGGRFGYKDQAETANTQVTVMEFGDVQLIFEVRGLPSDNYYRQGVGNTYEFEDGILASGKFYPKGSTEPVDPPAKSKVKRGPGKDHFGNFIAAVRSRNIEDLNADILEGHYSSGLCHLANASYRLGQEMPFDAYKQAFGESSAAGQTVARMGEHLTKNGVKLDGLQCHVGPSLQFDTEKEQVVGNADANTILTGKYREPFTLPSLG
ncbi:MAG: Gfo/Idh/MocA family oxidoreductase [Planctomycetota bacterium]|nr:Gfo/Idh/MocA family oxidoreductase [Planctomycetota bacterium]